MKKLLFLVVLGGAVYLLWGNVNWSGVKKKAQESEKQLSEETQKLKKNVSN